jgi:hypothetical protein
VEYDTTVAARFFELTPIIFYGIAPDVTDGGGGAASGVLANIVLDWFLTHVSQCISFQKRNLPFPFPTLRKSWIIEMW